MRLNKIRHWLLGVTLLFLLSSNGLAQEFGKKVTFKITGKIADLNAPARVLLYYGDHELTAELKDGRFTMEGEAVYGDVALLYMDREGVITERPFIAEDRESLVLRLEETEMTITSPDSLDKAVIENAPLTLQHLSYVDGILEMQDKKEEMLGWYESLPAESKEDERVKERYRQQVDNFNKWRLSKVHEFILKYPNSLISYESLRIYMARFDFPTADIGLMLYAILGDEIKKNDEVKELGELIRTNQPIRLSL